MKKLLLLTVAAVFASSMAFAAKDAKGELPRPPHDEIIKKKEGFCDRLKIGYKGPGDMGEAAKEYIQLGKEYREEKNEKKRAKIEDKITSKAAQDYDKRIAAMEERLGKAKERLSKMEAMISEAKKPESKEKHINRIKEDVITGKGFFSGDEQKPDRTDRKDGGKVKDERKK